MNDQINPAIFDLAKHINLWGKFRTCNQPNIVALNKEIRNKIDDFASAIHKENTTLIDSINEELAVLTESLVRIHKDIHKDDLGCSVR